MPFGEYMNFYESLNDVLEPPRIIRKTIMVPTVVDYCPHCNNEIQEKSIYVRDNQQYHNCCKLPIRSSIESEQDASNFFNKRD